MCAFLNGLYTFNPFSYYYKYTYYTVPVAEDYQKSFKPPHTLTALTDIVNNYTLTQEEIGISLRMESIDVVFKELSLSKLTVCSLIIV